MGMLGGNPLTRTDATGRWFWWGVGVGLVVWDMLKPIEPNPDYPDAISSIDTLPGPWKFASEAKTLERELRKRFAQQQKKGQKTAS